MSQSTGNFDPSSTSASKDSKNTHVTPEGEKRRTRDKSKERDGSESTGGKDKEKDKEKGHDKKAARRSGSFLSISKPQKNGILAFFFLLFFSIFFLHISKTKK